MMNNAKPHRPTRILYISDFPHIGGGEGSLLTLLRHLDPRLYHPFVACYGQGELQGLLSKLGVDHFTLERRGLLSNFEIVRSLARFIKHKQIGLVHVNTLDIRAGLAARLAGVPLVGHLRVIFPFSWIDRLFVRLATRVISVSNAVRDHFCQQHPRLRCKFITIPNSVSLNKHNHTDIRAELGLPAQTRLVGAVARIDPWKGLHTFIQMAARLTQHLPDIHFLLAGSADLDDPESIAYETKLRQLVTEHTLENTFTFLGFREDALSLIEQLNVLVLPSLILKTPTGLKTEGFGRVIVEAMALGTPVVATRVGGIPEIIEHGESGLLVPPESPDEMAETVKKLLCDPNLYNKISAAGKQRFMDQYHIETHIYRIQTVYKQALRNSPIPRRETHV